MAKNGSLINRKTALSATLLGFCGLLMLSGLAVIFVKSPHEKATDLIALAAYYETQLQQPELSLDAQKFLRAQKQNYLKQAWNIAPFHAKFYDSYNNAPATQKLAYKNRMLEYAQGY